MRSPWNYRPATQELLALGALTRDVRPPFLSRTIKNTIDSENQKKMMFIQIGHIGKKSN